MKLDCINTLLLVGFLSAFLGGLLGNVPMFGMGVVWVFIPCAFYLMRYLRIV